MLNSLAVLILSRGRPQVLEETLRHMIGNARLIDELARSGLDKLESRLSISVRIDADDQATQDIVANWPLVNWTIGQRPMTLGEGYNGLWRTAKADCYMIAMDDHLILTPNWDETVLDTMNETSLGYFPEEDHSRGAVTRYVLPRLWAETAGYVVSEWFPYWFVDTWWDHIAAMIGNKIALPVAMRQNPNALGTTGMRDLELWTRLFHALEPERVAAAQNIRDRIYPQDSPAFKASLRQQEHWRRIVAEHSAIDPDLISRIEGEKAHTPPSERYLHAKRLAEAYLERLGGNAGSVNLR